MSRGRPTNENRKTAVDLGFPTYEGSPCKRCASTERYTTGGGCVKCARNKQTEQRDARRALKAMMASQASWEKPVDSEPEAVLEEDDELRDLDDDIDFGETEEEREARRDASIEDLM